MLNLTSMTISFLNHLSQNSTSSSRKFSNILKKKTIRLGIVHCYFFLRFSRILIVFLLSFEINFYVCISFPCPWENIVRQRRKRKLFTEQWQHHAQSLSFRNFYICMSIWAGIATKTPDATAIAVAVLFF